MDDSKRTDCESLFQQADKAGAVEVTADGKRYYVVRPDLVVTEGPSPYANASTVLAPPLQRQAYSDRTAWLMGTLAMLVYNRFEDGPEQVQTLTATLAQAGIQLITTFNCPTTDTQAFLCRRPGQFRVLAFRGTEDRQDAITDISAMFRHTPFGRAHEGFLGAYESVQAEIETALGRTEGEGMTEPLLICGHSLGGALATMATRFLETKRLVSACYTYGSPRVGDDQFADSFKTPVYRVVNHADPVPMVPASGLLKWIISALARVPVLSWIMAPLTRLLNNGFVGYQHVGDLRLLYGDKDATRLKTGSAAQWIRAKCMLLDNLTRPHALIMLAKIGDDHRMAHYVSGLRQVAESRN